MMSLRAWVYVWAVILSGIALTGLAILIPIPLSSEWLAFVVLTLLATLAQLFKVNAPNRKLYYSTFVFVFAGLLILHPFLFGMLVIISYSVEWVKERLAKSPDLRDWYLQPFNIAMVIISGASARVVITLLGLDVFDPSGLASVGAAVLAAVCYVATNQVLLALALIMARGVSWKEVSSVDVENVQADLIHTLLGYVVAIVWRIDPWLIVPALAPLLLTYRALQLPQLKKVATTDAKTGLWNAAQFVKLYGTEFERAKRFERPLAVIMADIDLLRNINNTYGHLAGDDVLAGIGQIIRSTIREYDIAARFGGEEFVIVLPETDQAESIVIADRLRQVIESTRFRTRTSDTLIHASMSFGIAHFPDDAVTSTDLIHQADLAVYHAKLKGRNCVVSASDLPRSLRIEHLPDNRLSMATDEFVAAMLQTHDPAPKTSLIASLEVKGSPPAPPALEVNLPLVVWVGGVIAAAFFAVVLGGQSDALPSPVTVGILSLIAGLAEYFEVCLYDDSTFSVSAAVIFASALVTGVWGIACVSVAIVFVHSWRNRDIALYKSAFNWATHVLSGFVPLIAFRLMQAPLEITNITSLMLVTLVSAVTYCIVETGLVSVAIGMSGRRNVLSLWREQFRWTATFYIALCLVGLFMSIIYSDVHIGLPGLTLFVVPMTIIYFAQKQYVERTEKSVSELHRMNAELALANRQVINASRTIRQLNDDLFVTVSKIIDARDPYVLGHATKVADYALAIAEEMNLPHDRREQLRQAALLHDIGKIGVSEEILNKPAKLTSLEYEHVKDHAIIGAELLEASQGLCHLATFVRHHHEWWNGKGYPDSWAGEQIPLEARILAVCDALESMASDRPYQHAMRSAAIVAEIEKQSGTQFDPEVVEVFKRIVKQKSETLVVNSTRQIAQMRAIRLGEDDRDIWALRPNGLEGGIAYAD